MADNSAILLRHTLFMNRQDIDFFDSLAPRWDAAEVRSLPDKVSYILDLIGLRPGMAVADLGCGTGVLIPHILRRIAPGGSLDAIDASPGMLAVAKEKFSDHALRLLDIDFEETSLPRRYDLLILYCVYPHLYRPLETLRRLRDDHLLPDGRIIIAFPNDESFVNHVHEGVKEDSRLLPSAPAPALSLFDNGFHAKILESSPEAYIIELVRN